MFLEPFKDRKEFFGMGNFDLKKVKVISKCNKRQEFYKETRKVTVITMIIWLFRVLDNFEISLKWT